MIGPNKPAAMRAKLRETFNMTDAELLALFNARIGEQVRSAEPDRVTIESLKLLRDALVKAVSPPEQRKRTRPAQTKK